jgi:hypothetical protein
MRTVFLAASFLLTALCGLQAQIPQPSPVLSPGSSNSWNLDWDGVSGRTYFLQHSDNLVDWQFFPLIEPGYGNPIPYGFATSAEKCFVRLMYTDVVTSNPYWDDFDGDGISNWDEVNIHGTNPLNSDSDGDGVPDGAEASLGTDPADPQSLPAFWWQRTTRNLQYDFDDYEPPNNTGILVRSALWDASLNSTEQLSAPIPFPDLKARLEQLAFPATLPPAEGASGLLKAEGYSTLLPNPPCYHATLEHHRIWLRRPAAVAETLTQKVTIVSERTVDGVDEPLEFEVETLTIPSGQSRSPSLDIDPGFQEAFSGNEFHSEEIVRKPFRTEILITKDGEATAPADGLIVKTSDTVRYRLFPDEPDTPLLYEDDIKWYWRILKWDGTYSAWTAYQDGQGHTFTAQPLDAGIYEVKAEIDFHTVFYVRAINDPHSTKKKGDNECFGVVDEQWQLDVRHQAKINLGSVAYAQGVANSNVPAGPPGGYKCNLFVGHKASDAGTVVPKVNGNHPLSKYYPTANQWAGTEVKAIPGWTLLPAATYPQSGFVVARGVAGGIGHTGVVDYDGAWISAGTTNVNRIADVRTYVPSRFRKYTP